MDSRATVDWDAVFWDIGGVILDLESVSQAHEDFIRSVVEELGVEVSPDAALQTMQSVIGEYFSSRDGTEFRKATRAYRLAVETVADQPVTEAFVVSHALRAMEANYDPEPHAISVIEALADRPVHLGVLSDIDTAEGEVILSLFDVRSYFDSITTSEEVNRTKPDPAMFETALDKADVEPEDALMIGDRYGHDMAGAKRHGITTVAYGASDGPAVDYRIENLDELLDIV